jgi:murein L,D-transpeptidase YcbB/YkuD
MKKQTALTNHYNYARKANTLLLVCLFLLTLMLAFFTAKSADSKPIKAVDDQQLSAEIARQLNTSDLSLNFPLTVKRFYKERLFKQSWIITEADAGQTWSAMLMIDCVLQFGLNKADYHPDELVYSKLHDILDHPGQVPLVQQARYEIMLTDAIVSFTNHIHFGKYNPEYATEKIDGGGLAFNAADQINKALADKNFMAVLTNAQPQNKLYQNLQARMHVVAGVQLGDCYEFPEAEVRKMALNMERLRWAALDTGSFIQVNVPSFKLSFYHNGGVDTFRVVVGKPGNPTPTLNSSIKYFTTSPEWKVPQSIFVKELLPKAIRDIAYLTNNHYAIYNDAGMLITPNKAYLLKIKQAPHRYRATQSAGCDNALGQLVFRFANIYDVYLHDTPAQDLFYKEDRAYSHGCIRVQYPVKLAKMLLENDGVPTAIPAMENAINNGVKKNFNLKKAMPIAITYLTCEMVDGALVVYKDIYNLDNSLDMLMYTKNDPALKISQVKK